MRNRDAYVYIFYAPKVQDQTDFCIDEMFIVILRQANRI